jgi:hypothetical protein
MAAGSGGGGTNDGDEVLENGSERHPDGAGAGSNFGILSGALPRASYASVTTLTNGTPPTEADAWA